MATATKKSATKKTPARKSATGSTAAKKSTAKKSTARKSTARKSAASKTGTKRAAASTGGGSQRASADKATPESAPRRPLRDRDPRTVLEDAGYAVTGVIGDVVDVARRLPTRADHALRASARTLRPESPAQVGSQLQDLRARITRDAEQLAATFEQRFDRKAREGREVAERVRDDERVATILDRTGISRSQVKSAVTSATRTADVAVEAGRKQLDIARSQAKGAVTSASKAPEAARAAGRPQAENARQQAKAAATSVRRSAEEIADTVS